MKQLLCPIAKSALLNPNHLAIETDTFSFSYKELEKNIQSTQFYLRTLNISSKKIAVIATLSLETLLIYFAALREGFSVCMLNPKDPPSLLEEKIQDLDVTVVTMPSFIEPSAFTFNTSISENHLSTYLYTSGSSSKPKIACLSFQNHYYNALGILDILKITSSSRYLLSLPLYHVSGISIMFRSFLKGATLVISSSNDVSSDLLINKQISHISLVSTQYTRLLKAFNTSLLKTLKAILLGGSSFSKPVLEEGILKNIPLYLSYGLTEMGSAVSCNPLLITRNTNSSGFLLPYRKLKIDNTGEILVSGKTLFQGYYCNRTKAPILKKGWFKTKDIGCFSEKEGLSLQGRKDSLIISGGENIQPEEIEQLLLSLDGVHNAIIVSLPDSEFGQKMVAIVHSDPLLCLNELPKRLSKRLPKYKLPKSYLPWPEGFSPSSFKNSSSLRESLYKYALSMTLN